MQKKSKIILTAVLSLLVVGNIFFSYNYIVSLRKIDDMKQNEKINGNILSFTQLFMQKVLQGSKTVSFDDRLELENLVRSINDKDIFNSWKNFTNSKNQTETQQYFYSLFDLLLKKISINS